MDLEQQLRGSLQQYLGTKSVPKKRLPNGLVVVTGGARYERPLSQIAARCGIQLATLSRFASGRGSLSLAAASRLAKELGLRFTKAK